MNRSFIVTAILICTFISACSATNIELDNTPIQTDTENTITIYAASSLTDAFSEIGKRFEAENPGTKIVFNFAGSQQLAQQLGQGAPADIFISADQDQMRMVIASERVKSENVKVLVGNKLAIVLAADNHANIRRLIDLARPGVKLIIADKEVPLGNYTLDFLKKASQDAAFGQEYKQNVLNNVISYEQSARVVYNKIMQGEADIGIIYASDVNEQNQEQALTLPIPDPLNVNVSYYIAPLNNNHNAELSAKFLSYALSMEVQDIMASYGFQPVY
jgi:molybdate transport system substrate-binding protein